MGKAAKTTKNINLAMKGYSHEKETAFSFEK